MAEAATRLFHTFDDKTPDLIQTGLGPVDRVIGGLFAGQGGILGMAQGVGKSRSILSAAVNAKDRHGIIFNEDTEDVVGSRALAWDTGINSLDLRRKSLGPGEVGRVAKSIDRLRHHDGVLVVCHPGASLAQILEYVKEFGERGCRLVWLDYVQKVRGISEARNVEVATVYTSFQRACFEGGMAFMVASQFARQLDPTKRPQMSWLKETGDLENEARVGVLGWRNADDPELVHYVLAKSTVGGEGVTWSARTDASGTLREVDRLSPPGGDW